MAHKQVEKKSDRVFCGGILRRWEQLTTRDIEVCVTDRAKLTDILQARYGYAKRRAEREVELFIGEFLDRLRLAA
mgnify:CR=1 FL=1